MPDLVKDHHNENYGCLFFEASNKPFQFCFFLPADNHKDFLNCQIKITNSLTEFSLDQKGKSVTERSNKLKR